MCSASQGMVCFEVASTQGKGKAILVEAVVLPTVITDLPTQPVAYDHGWKHHPGFGGESGQIVVLLGADVFSRACAMASGVDLPGPQPPSVPTLDGSSRAVSRQDACHGRLQVAVSLPIPCKVTPGM